MVAAARCRPRSRSSRGRRYPYYVSSISKDIDRETRAHKALPPTRIAARAIESAVRDAVHTLLQDEDAIVRLDPDTSATLTLLRLDTAAELAQHIGPQASLGARMMFERLQLSIIIHPDRIEANLSRDALIAKAHQARADLFSGAAPRGNRHIERLARLAYLAPDITAAILDGDQPTTLTSHKLLKLPALPLDWDGQRLMLGFTQSRSG